MPLMSSNAADIHFRLWDVGVIITFRLNVLILREIDLRDILSAKVAVVRLN